MANTPRNAHVGQLQLYKALMLHTNVMYAYFALHSYTSQKAKHHTPLTCGKIWRAECGDCEEMSGWHILLVMPTFCICVMVNALCQ